MTAKPWLRTLLAAAGAAALVAGCTTATPYQPLERGSKVRGGFTEQRIEANRYRVNFAGNSLTSRDTVETYLLFRAAELTLEQGYDWFVMADRDTEKRTRTYVDQPFRPGPWGWWGPRWSYYGRGRGWRHWDPFWGDPFWDRDIDVRTVDRYEATAEIVMRRGAKPADNPRAFDAHAVVENLRARIVPPR